MSITQARTLIEKTGCGTWLLLAVAITMVFGYSSTQCSRARNEEELMKQKQGSKQGEAIASLGTSSIFAESIEQAFAAQKDQFNQMQNQQGGQAEPIAPGIEASAYAQALVATVTQAVVSEVAKENGVTIADDAVRANLDKSMKEQLDRIKAQFISDKKLKTGASEAEFDAILQKEMGVSLAKVNERVEQILADPMQKSKAISEMLQKNLLDHFKSTINPTEDEVKLSAASMTVHRIFVSKADRNKLDEALEAIKKGMSFEDAVNKFSQDPKFGEGKITDNPRPFMMSQALGEPGLADMKNAKIGYVSKVCEEPDGYSVYKVLTMSNDPKEYEKNKAKLREGLVGQLANAKYSAAVKAKQDKGGISWKSTGFKALYDVGMALAKADNNSKVFDEVLNMNTANTADMYGQRAMAYAKYFAMSQVWNKLDDAGKTKRAPQKIEVLQSMLQVFDSPDLRLDMAECFLRLKDKAVVEQILLAANNNMSYLGANGKLNFDKVTETLAKAKTAGLVDAKAEGEILKAQGQWKTEYKRVQEEIAKQKAEEEKMRKQAEEESKKAEEEAKKKAETEKKSGGASTATPGTKPLDSSALGGTPPATPPSAPAKPGG